MQWSPVINLFVDCENAEFEFQSMKQTPNNNGSLQESNI